MLRSVELFSGAGGLALGVHLAGFQHVALIEKNSIACDTLRRNVALGKIDRVTTWPVLQDDVTAADLGDAGAIDLVAAGVPCQPFSNGGKRLGLDDERNMFPAFAKMLAALRPRAFLLENVGGLARRGAENHFAYVCLQLAHPTKLAFGKSWRRHFSELQRTHTGDLDAPSERYNVIHQVVNSADYGIPQIRRRVFFVGVRADVHFEWQFPAATHSRQALIRDQWLDADYWERHGARRSRSHEPPLGTLRTLEQVGPDGLLPWRTVRDAIGDLPHPSTRSDFAQHDLISGARSYPGHCGSSFDQPAKSLKAGVHGVPGGENMLAYGNGKIRYFTMRECARLQTFPDQWEFAGGRSEITRQIGNAVPVELARLLAKSLASKLTDTAAHHSSGGGSTR